MNMLDSAFAGALAAKDPSSTLPATPRAGAVNVRLTVITLVLAYCFYRYVQKQLQYKVC